VPRVEGATGGPVRVIARVPKAETPELDDRWQSDALEDILQ
jgi:hypothetical protein